MTRILVIVHESSCSPGRLGQVWRDAGADVVEVSAWNQPVPPIVDADALVVLGGSMGCQDDAEAPWLASTRQLISRTVKAGTPFLGVCLGHQLATVALGGRVCTSDHLCLGPVEMHLTPDGEKDPLLSVYDGHRGIHFNNDVAVVLPEGAVLLARDPTGQVEAVRFAERAWGSSSIPSAPLTVGPLATPRKNGNNVFPGQKPLSRQRQCVATSTSSMLMGPSLRNSWNLWALRKEGSRDLAKSREPWQF